MLNSNVWLIFALCITKCRKKTASEDSGSVTSRDQATKLGEQNVDFELDVKVFIDSGKCVLYPKEAKEEEVRK